MTFFQPVIDNKTGRAWCGPAAIAILTGVPNSRIEKMLKRGRKGWGNRPIKGTYNHEVIRVLKRLGCKVQELKNLESTICKFADDVRHAGAYLVNVTNHYMVTCAGVLADNSHPTGVPAEQYGRTRHVQRAWKVVAPALPRFTIDDALVASRPAKPKMDIKLRRVNKVTASIKRWERKEKLAKTKLKKLRRQLAYYKAKGLAL